MAAPWAEKMPGPVSPPAAALSPHICCAAPLFGGATRKTPIWIPRWLPAPARGPAGPSAASAPASYPAAYRRPPPWSCPAWPRRTDPSPCGYPAPLRRWRRPPRRSARNKIGTSPCHLSFPPATIHHPPRCGKRRFVLPSLPCIHMKRFASILHAALPAGIEKGQGSRPALFLGIIGDLGEKKERKVEK